MDLGVQLAVLPLDVCVVVGKRLLSLSLKLLIYPLLYFMGLG